MRFHSFAKLIFEERFELIATSITEIFSINKNAKAEPTSLDIAIKFIFH